MNLFFSSLLSAWGNALLAFLWQGALVGIAAALLLRFSRQAKPQIRYAIACMALALCFTLPIASVWRSLSIDALADTSFSEMQTVAHVGADMNSAMSVNTISELMNNQMPWLVIVWSLGCAFFSLRMAMGLSWIASARRDASKNTDASLQSKLNLLAIQFGLQGRIQLLICNEIDSPVTVGWWKPVVFVPAALATRLPPDYIEALLAHELAHIKRF
jgi:beta-lactamase regulating signal transducer with metallopeptidase domain